MRTPPRSLVAAAAYIALATWVTWPALLHPVSAVPGGPRTDLADSLWSLWYVARNLAEGTLPGRVDGLLNHPHGGAFWPADLLNGVLGAPLVWLWGPAVAWSVLATAHVAVAGMAAHAVAERAGGRGWVAGPLYAAAPITLAHLQNGASEAVGGTSTLALAVLAVLWLRETPSWGRATLTAFALAVAAVAHAYTGVLAFIFAAACLLLSPGVRATLAAALVLGALAAAGPAAMALEQSTASDNVVGIKTDRELDTIRRSIGPADPEVFVHPGNFRSPDFRELSRYGEELVHCSYLGWVMLATALFSLRRRAGSGLWWGAVGVSLVLAMGPVLVANGGPVILPGRRAVPLPYLLLEGLPGFASLSLLWRLAQLAALALAVLAARAVNERFGMAVVALALAETAWLSPVRGLPQGWDSTVAPEIAVLADAPEGAVMNFPVVGGRAYLWEQITHGQAVTGTLNFPNNSASRKVWKVAIDNATIPYEDFRTVVSAAARESGVRYLVVHIDARAADDTLHAGAVATIREAYTPLAESSSVRVYRFW